MTENKPTQNKTDETPKSETTSEASVSANLEAELAKTKAELESFKAKYLTAVADLDNARKRYQREREEMYRYGAAPVAQALLPFADNYALALKSAEEHHPEAKAILQGFGMLKAQLEAIFDTLSIKTIAPKAGDNFNPELHESVGEAPDEKVAHHHILSLQRSGYTLHERLLRPAMVILSSGKPEAKK